MLSSFSQLDRNKIMTGYASIDEFNRGWNFFIREIQEERQGGRKKYGEFPCSTFLCSGCHDWLDSNNQKRNVYNLQNQFLVIDLLTVQSNFKPNLISVIGEGGQAKVFRATFHGQDVAIKYIPLDKVKHREYRYKRVVMDVMNLTNRKRSVLLVKNITSN